MVAPPLDAVDGLTSSASYDVTDDLTPSTSSSIEIKKRHNKFQDSQRKAKKKKE
jgi:hypothetical protein